MPAPWWTALRRSTPTVAPDLPTWWAWHRQVTAATPLARAALAAARADRLATAFVSGYQAALEAMFGECSLGAFAVTEAGGGHPRAIATRLDDRKLVGTKTFVTGGRSAEVVWVVARTDDPQATRPSLKVVRVPTTAPGLTWSDGPTPPFVPEVDHGVLTLDGTPATDVLDGDGYARFVKPFRTVEDVHVLAAALGMALGASARVHHPDEAWTEEALALLVTVDHLAAHRPTDVAVHLPLAAVFRRARPLLDQAPWPADMPWARDRALLTLAGVVRDRRTQRAWESWR